MEIVLLPPSNMSYTRSDTGIYLPYLADIHRDVGFSGVSDV